MLRYSLKRLLLSLPVLWLLITAIFLISRLLPGTYGSENILYDESSTLSKSTQQQRNETYRAYLHRTGQDLPVFYFSIKTGADPRCNECTASSRLETRLSWIYGSVPHTQAFIKAIATLETVLKQEQNSINLNVLKKLQNTTEADSILYYSKALTKRPSSKQTQYAASGLYQSAVTLVKDKENLHYLLPSITWHGTNNQYHQWLSMLLKGNLGNSFRDARPVTEILWEAISNTFWLTFLSMFLVFLIALELSVLMVRSTKRNWRKFFLPFLFILDSIPLFVLSLVLLILFASPDFLPLFPVFGLGYYADQTGTWFEQLLHNGPYLILPITSLVLVNLPYLTNHTYRSLADTMQDNYIKTARSKGLKENNIIRKHALRNALIPVITILSDYLPALIAGSVVIETIFAIPGIGRLLLTSVLARDTPVILGIILLTALVKMVSHFVADVCYAQADPRVRKAASI